MEKIIEVTDLKKSYGSVEAVRGISFYVERGAFFAFLGPNGAGKSTTINILNTLMEADGGEVRISGLLLGKDDQAIRKLLGTVFQEHVLDDRLTVKENLFSRGSFYYQDRKDLARAVDQAAQTAGVEDYLNRRYGQLSGGQKRRSDIARALVHVPKILVLDEPTTGLDPQTRENIWEVMERLRAEKDLTIFLTTHYMEEAAQADYVVIIDEGLIAARGTPADLKDRYSRDSLVLAAFDPEKLEKVLMDQNRSYKRQGERFSIDLGHSLEALPLLDLLRDQVKSFQVIEGDMNDAFLNITGRGLRE